MSRVVRADGELGACGGHGLRGIEDDAGHAFVVLGVKGGHPLGERDRIQGDPWVVVLAHQAERFAAHELVAERGALGAAGDDSDVLRARMLRVVAAITGRVVDVSRPPGGRIRPSRLSLCAEELCQRREVQCEILSGGKRVRSPFAATW